MARIMVTFAVNMQSGGYLVVVLGNGVEYFVEEYYAENLALLVAGDHVTFLC